MTDWLQRPAGRGRRLTFLLVLAFIFCASGTGAALADGGGWDTSQLGVSKDWFETGANAKNKGAATARLKKLTECTECQSQADKLQALLDAWYLTEYQDGKELKTKGVSNPDTHEGSEQQKTGRAMQQEAATGLGGLSSSEIGRKIQQAAKNRDPNIPQDKAKLADAIKAAAAALQKCLDECRKKAATPPPAETPAMPGNNSAPQNQSGGEEVKPDHVIGLDFIVNRGATIKPADVDAALKQINEAFAKTGIGFSRSTFTPVNNKDIPETPQHGAAENQSSDDQKKVAKEAQKIEQGLTAPHGAIPVKIVKNFQSPNRLQGYSDISGIQMGDVVLIADPDHVESNSMGRDNFSHVLAHELGHVLGLEHEVLPSDKNYKNQENGRYAPPNVMGNGSEWHGGPGELTQDQIDEIKKHAVRFYETAKTTGGGSGGGHVTKRPRKSRRARREDDPLIMEGYTPHRTSKKHAPSSGSSQSLPPGYVPPEDNGETQEPEHHSVDIPNPEDLPHRPDDSTPH